MNVKVTKNSEVPVSHYIKNNRDPFHYSHDMIMLLFSLYMISAFSYIKMVLFLCTSTFNIYYCWNM